MIDPHGDPQMVERAAWATLRAAGRLPEVTGDAKGAAWLEKDEFARILLAEAPVTDPDVERRLTAIRRYVLLSGQGGKFPCAVDALIWQATLNQGAWPFDDQERRSLESGDAGDFSAAYLPPRARPDPPNKFASPVTRAVAEQYTAWPFPVWRRVLGPPRQTLSERLALLGPGTPTPPSRPVLLVAGCGTGREALRLARAAPDAQVVGIDLSGSSLDHARDRCANQTNIRFETRDLHSVGEMGLKFDYISCCGVLHHLPDPEAGWAALVDVLKPGGMMRVMLYSRLARLHVTAGRQPLGDLLGETVTDDIIREARARLLAEPSNRLLNSPGFYTLGGAYDLLLPEHEDPFDVPRIGRAIDRLQLKLLRFGLPDEVSEACYRKANPHDPWRRDLAAWDAFERLNSLTHATMYDFTCVRPV